MMSSSTSHGGTYQPGVCNIGAAEIRKRKLVSYLGLALTIALYIMLLVLGEPRISGLFIFIPAMIAAVGYVQSKKRFCFAFGLMGVFNFGGSADMQKIYSNEDRRADRAMVLRIVLESFLIAVAITLVGILVL